MGGLNEEVVKDDTPRSKRKPDGSGPGELIQPDGGPPAAAAPAVPPPVAPPAAAAGGRPQSRARELLAALGAASFGGTGPPAGLGGRALRTHQANGEMHFHDDVLGLKASMPMAEWWTAHRKLHSLEKCLYFDNQHGTLLTIIVWIDDDGAGGDEAKLTMTLAPCKKSLAFEQLDRASKRA